MSVEGTVPDDGREAAGLRGAAAQVVVEVEAWVADGLGHDVALALVQNALPLTEEVAVLPRLQRRAHARALAALLLLLDDPVAGDLGTDLVEVLHAGASRVPELTG